VAAAYLWFRYLGPGTSHVTGGFVDHHMRLSLSPFLDVLHWFAGRYLVRTVAYGLYNFCHIDKGWLAILVLLDLVLLIVVARVVRTVARDLSRDAAYLTRVGLVMFPVSLLPILLGGEGVAGRHLILPMLAIIIVVAIRFPRLGMAARQTWATLLLVILLPVAQGTAWLQMVSCRITGSLFSTLTEGHSKLKISKDVVVDSRSFADAIPYTWVNNPNNILNTYYGAKPSKTGESDHGAGNHQ